MAEAPQEASAGDVDPEMEEEKPSPEMQGRSLAAPKRRGLAAAMVNQARGRWGRAKNMLLAASRVRRLALADNADFKRENAQALDAAVKGHINVVLNVEKPRDLSSINYAQQGNAAMYTPEVMSKRHSNRTDTSLIEVLRHWWRWLPKAEQEVMEVAPAAPTLRSAAVRFAQDSLPLPEPTSADPSVAADAAAEDGGEGSADEGAGEGGGRRMLQSRVSLHTRLDGGSGGVALASAAEENGGEAQGGGTAVLKVAALDRAIYSAMVVAITMVLLPRFGLKADPDYDPSEDWLDDNKGLPYMDFPNFFDAMFELADMWAEGTDVREYVELLLTTLHDVQKMDAADGTFSRLLKKFGYKPDFRPAREPLFPPEPPPPPPPAPPPKRAPSPESEPSRPSRPIPTHAPIRTDHVSSRVASHIRSFRSFREQGNGHWEGWDSAAGAAATEGGETAHEGGQLRPHPNAHMFSYGGGNHGDGRGLLPGSPAPDYAGVGGSGYGSAGGRGAPRRRGPFVMPAPVKADYSGIRSTVADLTAPPRRPDAATLGEWRRLRQQRQQQRLMSARIGGKEQGVGGIPLALRRAEVADPGALGPGGLGGPGRGSGSVVHAYEEYMHDMAARYLSSQEALLVATSAAAAAAAEQVLAAAGWAQQQAQQQAEGAELDAGSAYQQQLWETEMDPGPAAATAATAAAAAQQVAAGTLLPALAASGSGQIWPPRSYGTGGAGSAGASPHASPRTSGAMPTATAMPAVFSVDADQDQDQDPDPATAAPDATTAASTSGSAGLACRASRLGSRALLSGGASSQSLPATPRGGVSITVGAGAGSGGGGSGTPAPPPALPQLWGPPLDPQAQITAITGRPAPATGPGAAGADGAGGAGGGSAAAAALAAEGSSASLAPSSLGPGGTSAASTARSPLSRRQAAGGEAVVDVDAGASPALPSAYAPLTAGSDAGMGSGVDAATAAAQAEVVVAFAQAAYRLADPNVHSLLLPSRVHPGAGPHFPAHTAGARGYSGRRSPQRAMSPPGAPGVAAPDAGRPSSCRPRGGSSRAGRPAMAEGRERFAAYLQAPAAAAASAATAARYGSTAARPGTADGEAGAGSEGWGWTPGSDSSAPDAAAAAAAAGDVSWGCDGVEAGAGAPQPTAGPLSGTPFILHRATTADLGALPRRPGSSPTPDYWFRPGHVAASSSERAATTAAALLGGTVSRRLASVASTSASCDLGSAGGGAGGLPVGRTASGSNWFSAVPQLRLPGHGGSVTAGTATAPCSPGVAGEPLTSSHSATAPSNAHGSGAGVLLSGSPAALSPSGAAGAGAGAGFGNPYTAATAQRRPGMLGSRAGGGGGVWGHGGGRMSARGGSAAVNSGGGGGTGVVMPHGSMSNKLHTFYTTAPTGVVTPDGQVMVLPPGYTAASAAGAGAAAEGAGSDNRGGAEVGAQVEAAQAQSQGPAAAGRRNRSGPVPTAVAAAPADAGFQRGAVRSPLRIRSSDPVGFSDAVTAARLNVAIMADELAARLAYQRAAERQQRLAVSLSATGSLRQGPATSAGAAREAVRSSFGAFMAAREVAASGEAHPAAAGSASGEGCAAE
ncbi:hypothetical protein HXX76_008999 [Chlamydomonas incerta]|uniref:Uncharacterized protein n=1 Tax=Chlamydomonas incerta TaxID=51695 RepID=A0A835VWM4_CHLIN|nr:hypothetical protein HXX76_008999 [Chlamydomonas incerta]|eukprot:KAG2432072.1 hypothetical protein HXX76_008999 [Chlamydomonas incerta]